MKTTSGGVDHGAAVAEIQGLYGPFSFPEKLLQRIWLDGDFDGRGARTNDGRSVRVLHPGRWNRLGGPDFKGARLRIGETETMGDVEVHLRAADWRSHGHSGDPAYADVVLHVVLFPAEERFTAGCAGRALPVLELLPLLHHDLEAYAADAAVEGLAGHALGRMRDVLSALPVRELRRELWRRAERRWRQKIHFAKVRIAKLGWESACHHAALEILGYRFNRTPMLVVAGAFSLERWRGESEGARGAALVAEAMDGQAQAGRWSVQGVRPLNRPAVRLRQYSEWVRAAPEWPRAVADMSRWIDALTVPAVASGEDRDVGETTSAFRRRHKLSALRRKIATEVCGEAIGGSRLDTLICDGFWPLLAAREERLAEALGEVWRHWFLGDVSEKFGPLLRSLEVIERRQWPASHGIMQGLLEWFIAIERENDLGEASAGRGT